VCNNYLDLSRYELTSEDFAKILYCLENPMKVPSSLRANVVDFSNSIIINPNNEEVEITKDLFPSNIFDSNVNFIFSQ
jgi:hypothetical protein